MACCLVRNTLHAFEVSFLLGNQSHVRLMMQHMLLLAERIHKSLQLTLIATGGGNYITWPYFYLFTIVAYQYGIPNSRLRLELVKLSIVARSEPGLKFAMWSPSHLVYGAFVHLAFKHAPEYNFLIPFSLTSLAQPQP